MDENYTRCECERDSGTGTLIVCEWCEAELVAKDEQECPTL